MKTKIILWSSLALFVIIFGISFFEFQASSSIANVTINGERVTNPFIVFPITIGAAFLVALILTATFVFLFFVLSGVGIFIALVFGFMGVCLLMVLAPFLLPFLLLGLIPVVIYWLLTRKNAPINSTM